MVITRRGERDLGGSATSELSSYPAELLHFPEGLLNEAFRKLFWSHAAGGSVRRNSYINLP